MLLVIAIGSSNIRIAFTREIKLRMQTSMRVDTQILPTNTPSRSSRPWGSLAAGRMRWKGPSSLR